MLICKEFYFERLAFILIFQKLPPSAFFGKATEKAEKPVAKHTSEKLPVM